MLRHLHRLWGQTTATGSIGLLLPDAEHAAALSAGERVQLVTRVFWLLLWRAPSKAEARETAESLADGLTPADFQQRVMASPEFRLLFSALQDHQQQRQDARKAEFGLQRLGDHETFVKAAYGVLLGRAADPGGAGYYVEQLEGGHTRVSVLEALIRSAEFKERYAAICPQAGFVPRDIQLCELANPAKWANPEWLALLKSLVVVPDDAQSMHRKGYEFTQLLFGLRRLGCVHADARILSVGAGHEPVLYWLAKCVRHVVATDAYTGVWSTRGAREGDGRVMENAAAFAPFSYHHDRLAFLKMDGRSLAFADTSFDVVYSLSAVEHFGGLEGARQSIAEMARVLKPGGVLALATEYCLSGPPHHEAFQPVQVHALLDHPSLSLVEPLDERVWSRYEYRAIDLRANPHQTPHMVVTDLGSVFTSVMAFLRKRA